MTASVDGTTVARSAGGSLPVMDVNKLVDDFIAEVIKREGDYSNHPADKGGPTRWGVTEQVARAFGYKGPMRELPIATAAQIYKGRYWFDVNFEQIASRYPMVAFEMFDTGINMGQVVAGRFLQRALNVFNREAADYPDIGMDGQVGRMTLFALDGFKRKRGSAGEAILVRALECQQGERYLDISEGRPANEAFTYGWFASRIGR